jgi:hypothetical protein
MKGLRLLLLFLLLSGALSGALSAQEVVRDVQQDGNIETVVIKRPKRVDKHEFRFGAGTYSVAADMFLDGIGCCDEELNFRDNMAVADTYLSKRRFWGTYSLGYTYHSLRWFQFGATVSFSAATQARHDNLTGNKVENLNQYAVGIMPTFRFIYLYRDDIQLYSAISLGAVLGTNMGGFWADTTLFGCSVGRNLFGFAEIGAGLGGWGRIGIGYRFDSSKKGKK